MYWVVCLAFAGFGARVADRRRAGDDHANRLALAGGNDAGLGGVARTAPEADMTTRNVYDALDNHQRRLLEPGDGDWVALARLRGREARCNRPGRNLPAGAASCTHSAGTAIPRHCEAAHLRLPR